MANNFTANPGPSTGGISFSSTQIDSFASYSSAGQGQTVCLYASVDTSTAAAPVVKANPLYVTMTNGTQNMPTMDAVGRAGFVKVTDGTNTQPTGDAAARKIFVQPTDGTNTQTIVTPNAAIAENTATASKTAAFLVGLDAAASAGSQGIPLNVVSTAAPWLKVAVFNSTNQMPAMDAVGRAGFVKVTDGTNTQPTGDAVGRKIFTAITNGTNTAAVGADLALSTSGGGASTVTIAAATDGVVKNAAGRLCRAIVTTAGTGSGSVLLYDNASTNTGTVIGVIPATIAVGTYYTFDMPAANGIYCKNQTNGPALTFSIN